MPATVNRGSSKNCGGEEAWGRESTAVQTSDCAQADAVISNANMTARNTSIQYYYCPCAITATAPEPVVPQRVRGVLSRARAESHGPFRCRLRLHKLAQGLNTIDQRKERCE